MLKWKYGSYQFAINPNSQSMSVDLIGDDMRTLSGAYISQPSLLQEKYNVSSVFYQPRSRVKSQSSIRTNTFIDYWNNQFYILDRANNVIDIYSKNLINKTGTISLAAVPDKNYTGFDVVSDGIWIVSTVNGTTDGIVKVNMSGTITVARFTLAKTINSTGIELFSGYIWVLRENGNIDKIRPTDKVKVATVVLPYGLYYYGLSSDAEFLIVGNRDSYSKIYHVDTANGRIVNQIHNDSMVSLVSIAFDGIDFYIADLVGGFQIIGGNTVQADLYRLQKEILTKKFVDLVDDMGVVTRVMVSDFRSNREISFEHLYVVSMTIVKVNRG